MVKRCIMLLNVGKIFVDMMFVSWCNFINGIEERGWLNVVYSKLFRLSWYLYLGLWMNVLNDELLN